MLNLDTQASDIIKLVIAFLTSGYTIYFLRDVSLEMRAQLKYEKSFMDKHPEVMMRQLSDDASSLDDFVIPLAFEHREAEHLQYLCKNYRSKWSPLYYVNRWCMRSREPAVETQYLRIRRLGRVPKPIKIEVIRCTEKWALIAVGDGRTGYILKQDKASLDPNRTIFNIDAKFLYKQESLQRTAHLSDWLSGQAESVEGQYRNNRTDEELQMY